MNRCTAQCPHTAPAREACHLEAGHAGPHELRTTHVPGRGPRAYCMWTTTEESR